MNDSPTRILTLLAASGLSAAEIRDFMEWAKHTNPRDVSMLYNRVRNQLRHISHDWMNEISFASTRVPAQHDSLYRDLQSLISLNGYTASDAVKRISHFLISSFPEKREEELEFKPKDGLRRWVIRAAREYGEGALLTAAVDAIAKRNRSADWRLE